MAAPSANTPAPGAALSNVSYEIGKATLQSILSNQQQSMEAHRRETVEQRLKQARRYRMGAEIARVRGDHANASLNFRRAFIAAPESEDGQFALGVLKEIHAEAERELARAEDLMAAGKHSDARDLLRQLKKNYAELSIAPRIDWALRRASFGVSMPEPQIVAHSINSRPEPSRPADDLESAASLKQGGLPSARKRDTISSVEKLSTAGAY